jgi:uncharacterized surface protein with fasciclin (FAS1) repeats
VLAYHVVPGRLDAAALNQDIKTGSGRDMLKTLEGDQLTLTGNGHDFMVTEKRAIWESDDCRCIPKQWRHHVVVDKVLMPN